jgi:hypothetical protein
MKTMMKKLRILIVASGMFIAGACGDGFLDTEPLTTLTDGNFYRTTGDAYKALVGCYDGLQIVWAGGVSFPVASDVFSDDAFGGTGNSDGFGYQMIDEFDKDRSPSDQNMFENNWIAYYRAIYRCNVLLGKMDQIDWTGNETLRLQYESEARFIRAYLYFDMVRLWENIPLLTEPSAENIPPAPPADVYKVIAEDLTFAADNLPAISYAAQPVAEHGRVTKWAASALIARVYLYYTGYYGQADLAGVVTGSQALGYLENTISNSGHALVEDFAGLWPAASLDAYAGEDNAETVFAIKYTYTSDYDGNTDGNHWMVMYGIREQTIYPYGNGWGGATVNPELWATYNDNDTRRAASIISIEDEGIDFQNIDRQREYTGYYSKKYSPMSFPDGRSVADSLSGGGGFMITQFQDYIAIRYADVLLMAAELGSPNDQGYLDAVRQRALKAAFVSIPVSQDNIMKERRLEFALEGIRYWDLLRQGVDVAANAIAESTQLLNGGVASDKVIQAAKIQATKGLQQIPGNQITLSSGVLTQNAGW